MNIRSLTLGLLLLLPLCACQEVVPETVELRIDIAADSRIEAEYGGRFTDLKDFFTVFDRNPAKRPAPQAIEQSARDMLAKTPPGWLRGDQVPQLAHLMRASGLRAGYAPSR